MVEFISKKKMIEMPNMLMIGSTCRNAGKTTLACKIIDRFNCQHTIVAIKVSIFNMATYEKSKSKYEIMEETNPAGEKDTCKLLSRNPEKVLWLKASYDTLYEGFRELMRIAPSDYIIVCESTSLRNFVRPGVFVIVKNNNESIKQSAQNVLRFADEIIANNVEEFNDFIDKLVISNNEWRIVNDKI